MADPELGFNLRDVTEYLYAGEVPPHEMYQLLTEEWEISETLSLALISLYGGDIWDTYQALMRLRDMKEDFFLFDSLLTSNIANCFQKGIDNEVIVRTLKLLSETGFSPLKDIDDSVAEILNRNYVAGIVKPASLNVGLPNSVWDDGCLFGLVPSSQSARLLIAEYLVDNKYA